MAASCSIFFVSSLLQAISTAIELVLFVISWLEAIGAAFEVVFPVVFGVTLCSLIRYLNWVKSCFASRCHLILLDCASSALLHGFGAGRKRTLIARGGCMQASISYSVI